jgi:regulator of protease activity HflC (stomatin/prohibitin superfamily)
MPELPDKPDTRATPPGDVATAMNRVLEAEREVLAELESCRAQADRTLEAARREARAILERAERVSRDIHSRTERLAAARALRIAEAAAQEDARPGVADTLAAALERLAARMTGGGDA